MSKADPDYESFTTIQSGLVDVIIELEEDLSNMRANTYTKQESIDSKNQQIEDLIAFSNDADYLLKLAKYKIYRINTIRRSVDDLTETVIDGKQRASEMIQILTDRLNGKG